ncbi:Uncharacterised protein [Brucella neotomae]|nr:Uncharacterised protein [Brucella neotomae]SUW60502.1 Uncharacterised protein [Brucella neotomae]
MRRPTHVLQNRGRRMLEGNIQIRQDLALGHQRNDFIDARVGIDVMHPHPNAHLAQFPREVEKLRTHRAVLPHGFLILDIEAIGARILRDDENFLHTRLNQFFSFAQHFVDRTRDQIAAQCRNDAEGTTVGAAFGNLQIGIMARGELHALRRHKIDKWVMGGRGNLVHRIHHAFIGLRAGDGEHIRMPLADNVRLCAKTAGDDHLAILVQCKADRFQRLVTRRIEKAAGINDH